MCKRSTLNMRCLKQITLMNKYFKFKNIYIVSNWQSFVITWLTLSITWSIDCIEARKMHTKVTWNLSQSKWSWQILLKNQGSTNHQVWLRPSEDPSICRLRTLVDRNLQTWVWHFVDTDPVQWLEPIRGSLVTTWAIDEQNQFNIEITRLRIISIFDDNGLELGPDDRRLRSFWRSE